MKQKIGLLVAGVGCLVPQLVLAQATVGTSAATASDIFYGGTIGMGFGDVSYFELSPMIGKHLTPQVSIGGSVMYRWRSDDRYSQELNTEDYGATIFGRYRVTPNAYLQAEYEYLDYEYYKLNLTTERSDFSSFLAGGGLSQPIGENSSAFVTVLYNFSYDEPDSPYDEPWVFRVGVGVGF